MVGAWDAAMNKTDTVPTTLPVHCQAEYLYPLTENFISYLVLKIHTPPLLKKALSSNSLIQSIGEDFMFSLQRPEFNPQSGT